MDGSLCDGLIVVIFEDNPNFYLNLWFFTARLNIAIMREILNDQINVRK